MRVKNFFGLFEEGLNDFFRNPRIVIPGLVLWGFIILFSRYGGGISQTQQTVISAYGLLIIFIVVLLSFTSFVFAGMIGMAKEIVSKKKGGGFFSDLGKFGLRNLWIISLITIVSVLIGRAAHYGAFYIGKTLNLGLGVAQFVFILIYFIGLIGVLIWFTFSSFFLVINRLDVGDSIKSSFSFVKMNYLATLSLSVMLFIIYYLVGMVAGRVGEALEYVILLPYATLVLTRFVLKNKK